MKEARGARGRRERGRGSSQVTGLSQLRHAEAPGAAAAREAWEEAGVRGRVTGGCLGVYSYTKEMDDGEMLPVVAMLYPVEVKITADKYPEAGQRRRKWMSRKKAAKMVSEPELARMIRDFDPRGRS